MVGHRFVEALLARDQDRSCDVLVLAEESRPAYDRVRLSSWFDDERLALPAPDRVDIHLGEPAIAVDPDARTGRTLLGSYRYDSLVLATGSYPFWPPGPRGHPPGWFAFRPLDG